MPLWQGKGQLQCPFSFHLSEWVSHPRAAAWVADLCLCAARICCADRRMSIGCHPSARGALASRTNHRQAYQLLAQTAKRHRQEVGSDATRDCLCQVWVKEPRPHCVHMFKLSCSGLVHNVMPAPTFRFKSHVIVVIRCHNTKPKSDIVRRDHCTVHG